MGGRQRPAPPEGRLTQLLAAWPSKVTWAQVREEDPTVFRQAAMGGLLICGAILVTLLWSLLTFDWPTLLELPGLLEWMRPMLMVIALFGAILLWLFGGILISMPSDTKRALAFKGYAEQVGLTFSRFGFASPTLGVFFAEKLPGLRDPARVRPPMNAEPPASLFRTTYVLWVGQDGLNPRLQFGLAAHQGDKSSPKGPRHAFRYLSMRLPRALPHLMIDARGNGSLRSLLPGSQRLQLEGDFDRYFTAYVPSGYERDALELLTPDVMACLIDHGRSWDIEVIDDTLQLASTKLHRWRDRSESAAMLLFAELVGAELGHQAATYSDPRAKTPRVQVAAQGRRLRRRSTAWTTTAFIVGVGVMMGYPFVLGWLLDR